MRAKRAKVSERSELRCVADSADAFGDTHINAFGDTHINAFGVWEGQRLGLDTHISEVHGKRQKLMLKRNAF